MTSPAFTPTQAGTYRWSASYSGDANNAHVSGGCNDANESTVVAPAPTSIATQASPNVALGAGSLTDEATVSGRVNPLAGATITFRLYGPNDATCSGAPVFASVAVAYPVAGGPVTSPAFTPTAAGTYRWIASYSGDANNAPVSGACNDPNESTFVASGTPTITTLASPNITLGAGTLTDTAIVSGRVNPLAGATVTFKLYGPNDAACASAPVFAPAPVAYPVAPAGQRRVQHGEKTSPRRAAHLAGSAGMGAWGRRLRASTLAMAAAGLAGAPCAVAADYRDRAWPRPADAAVVGDADHLVHFSAGAIGEQAANAALAYLATARRTFTGIGLRPPLPDAGRGGDDRYDLYLCSHVSVCFGRSARGGAPAELDPRRSNGTAPGYGPAPGYGFVFVAGARNPGKEVAHEYFHAWQQAYVALFGRGAPWWEELTAEWAANEVAPGERRGFTGEHLICPGAGNPLTDPCVNGAYGFHPFAAYLVIRYGIAVIRAVFAEQARLAALSPGSGYGRTALQNVLAARGSSLAAEFAGYARASIVGGFARVAPATPIHSRATLIVDEGSPPVAMTAWGMQFRFLENFAPNPIGVDVRGLDPALDGVAIGARHMPIPRSGRMGLLVPGHGRVQFSFTSASDTPRTTAFDVTRRSTAMSMSPAMRPLRRGATAIRLGCPPGVGGCRARLVLSLGLGRRGLMHDGPVVAVADGASRVVTVPLGTSIARRLRGRGRARLTVHQLQARPEMDETVLASRSLMLALR